MRPHVVVVEAPGFDPAPRIVKAQEPVSVETFVSEATVEALHKTVLDRLARPNEGQLDPTLVGPLVERRGGVDGLRWKHVDLNAGMLTLEDSKTGSQRRVIGQAAIDLLHAAKPESARPDDCVCPGPSNPRKPYRAINNARRLIWQATNLPLERGCDLHSLRHTFASLGAHVHNGRYAAFVAPLLGHGYQKRSITERYIHQSPEALRPAADAIAGTVALALRLTRKRTVVEFTRRQ